MWFWVFWIILVGLIGFAIYVRLVPIDAMRWHKRGNATMMQQSTSNSYMQRIVLEDQSDIEILTRLEEIALNTPRTTLLVGSVEDGMMTFVTRSLILGYPDYTSVGVFDDPIAGQAATYLEFNARAQYGTSDFGINRKRVKAWVSALQL